MLTDQPVGWRLVTDQAVSRSHADIKVVIRRVGLLRRKEHFIELSNRRTAARPELFTHDEWTSFVDNARYYVRDEHGGVKLGAIYWRKGEWDALLVAIARGAFMMLAHIPRTA